MRARAIANKTEGYSVNSTGRRLPGITQGLPVLPQASSPAAVTEYRFGHWVIDK